MAKKQESTAMTAAVAALERPSFIPAGDRTGTEHITRDDIQMPRLALAQQMSPELDDANDSKYIEGLRMGDMFNTLTKRIYGQGPIEFFIIRADPPRWVEFNPREEGGGVKDPNVPAGDPRTMFTTDPQGNSVSPVATKFYDYIVVLSPFEGDPMENVIALSFKSSGLKVARQLNGLIKFRNAPLYAGKYSVSTGDEQNAKGKFKQYVVKNAGWAESKEQADVLQKLHESFKDREITIDRGDAHEDEGDTSFNPDAM